MTYLDENNYFVSTSGTKILEVTPELIQKALILPFSCTMQSFIDATQAHHFRTLPPHEQQPFLDQIFASCVKSLPSNDSFPITLFKQPIWPILFTIACLFGEGISHMTNKAILGCLHKMKWSSCLLDIPLYLSIAICFQLHYFPATPHFHYYFLLFYLLMYTHVEEFECLGLNVIPPNKQWNSIFD